MIQVHFIDREQDEVWINPEHIAIVQQTPGGSEKNPLFGHEQAPPDTPEHLVQEPGTFVGLMGGRVIFIKETAAQVVHWAAEDILMNKMEQMRATMRLGSE